MPRDKHAIGYFLGFGNYFGKFILGSSTLVHALRHLQGKAVELKAACQEAFDGLKKAYVRHMSWLCWTSKSTSSYVDASGFGLGAVLMQDGRPLSPSP